MKRSGRNPGGPTSQAGARSPCLLFSSSAFKTLSCTRSSHHLPGLEVLVPGPGLATKAQADKDKVEEEEKEAVGARLPLLHGSWRESLEAAAAAADQTSRAPINTSQSLASPPLCLSPQTRTIGGGCTSLPRCAALGAVCFCPGSAGTSSHAAGLLLFLTYASDASSGTS